MENEQAKSATETHQDKVHIDAKPIQTAKKKGSNKIILIIVSILVLFLLICCCVFVFLSSFATSFLNEFQNQFEEGVYNQEIDLNNDLTQSNSTYLLGETVETKDLSIKVSKYEDPYMPTEEFYDPQEGYRLIAALVELSNNSNQPVNYSPYDFSISDEDNFEYDPYYSFIKKPEMISGSLSTEQEVQGWITFLVPETSQNLKLVYSDFYSGEEIQIQIN